MLSIPHLIYISNIDVLDPYVVKIIKYKAYVYPKALICSVFEQILRLKL